MAFSLMSRGSRVSLVISLTCGLVACGDDTPVAPQILPLASITLIVVDALSRPQSGAIVELRSGPEAGATTTTNAEGEAVISAHAPPSGLTFRVSKPGFKTAETTVWAPPSGTATTGVILDSENPLDLAGEHLLTIEASSACTGLPRPARRRVYEATATAVSGSQAGYLDIRLSGAQFVSNRNSLGVSVTADTAGFWVGVPSLDGEPIAEQLSPSSYLMFGGSATVEASQEDRVLSAPLRGRISYCPASLDANLMCSVPPVDCDSESHRLTFSRR